MGLSIDKKQTATIVVAGVVTAVILFFLNKWLVKTVKNPDGSKSSFVGHDAVGHF